MASILWLLIFNCKEKFSFFDNSGTDFSDQTMISCDTLLNCVGNNSRSIEKSPEHLLKSGWWNGQRKYHDVGTRIPKLKTSILLLLLYSLCFYTSCNWFLSLEIKGQQVSSLFQRSSQLILIMLSSEWFCFFYELLSITISLQNCSLIVPNAPIKYNCHYISIVFFSSILWQSLNIFKLFSFKITQQSDWLVVFV